MSDHAGTLGVASYLFSLGPRSEFAAELQQTNKAPEGFEPSTLRLLGVRSNQLSYGAAFGETVVMDGQTAIAAGLEPATVGSEVQRSSIEPRDRREVLAAATRREGGKGV